MPRYYRRFDVILIPYRVDDPFNRACSPTKIADGLGSGRPIVATAIPECRLYRHLFDVAEDASAFLALRGGASSPGARTTAGPGCGTPTPQAHSCARIAGELLQRLDSGSARSDSSEPAFARGNT